MNSLRQLCLAAVIAVSGLLGAVGASAQVVRAGQLPAPECRYDDVETLYTSPKSWRISLLDPIYMLPRTYVPSKLVPVSNAGIEGSGRVRRFVIADLRAMATAAREAGAPLRVTSAYRSYSDQATLYRREVKRFGLEAGRLRVARPGHSEHQLGTTLDFGSSGSNKNPWAYNDWAETAAGAWIMANGWRYGFLLSYPDNKKSVTCYSYEPWHWRYVGRELAADIEGTGLTLREYLWRDYH